MNTEKWTSKIDSLTENFIELFHQLSEEQLNQKPNESTWSIAQNMEHLIRVNESYFPIIESIHDGNYKIPFTGKVGFMVNFFGKMILKSVQPDRKKKTKTFSIWEPDENKTITHILSKFYAHQLELKQTIINSRHLLEKGTVISSPANKYIVYKLATAFDIIVAHEERHLEQAKEALSFLRK
ncbi:MAG TPA: DinB family protein [Hanamia sp.]|nr:DinB family protein [Hanamia sp.]